MTSRSLDPQHRLARRSAQRIALAARAFGVSATIASIIVYSDLPHARVGQLVEPHVDEGERAEDQDHRHRRLDRPPPPAIEERALALRRPDDVAEERLAQRTKAEHRQVERGEHRRKHLPDEGRRNERQQVGQDLLEDDAEVADARKLRDRDELALLHGQHLRADHQGRPHPGQHRDDERHGEERDVALVERAGDDDLDQQHRDRRQDVADACG